MAILDFMETISDKTVILDHAPFRDKDELFRFFAARFKEDGRILNEEDFVSALYQREDTGPTYMGEFIALPHGKSDTVQKNTIGFCRLTEPMLYRSFDEEGPVKLIFMLGVQGSAQGKEYLRILATLSRLLVYEEFISSLENAGSYEDVLKVFEEFLTD